MNKKKFSSLSNKIVFSIAFVSLIITLVVFIISSKINKEAFYQIEIEKADIIAQTIEPLIAVNIYLGMEERINQTILQLTENPNILAVKVLKNDKLIGYVESKEHKSSAKDFFVIKRAITQPNTTKTIGELVLTYSNKGYNELIAKYKNLTLMLVFTLVILFILFGLYVKNFSFH